VQGRVRTKTIKRSARVVVEKYYPKLGLDFHNNKRVVDDVAQLPSKRMRNKIAGFITVRWREVSLPVGGGGLGGWGRQVAGSRCAGGFGPEALPTPPPLPCPPLHCSLHMHIAVCTIFV
jgi:ribosomal protein S17E